MFLPATIVQIAALLGGNPAVVASVRAQIVAILDVGRGELLLSVRVGRPRRPTIEASPRRSLTGRC